MSPPPKRILNFGHWFVLFNPTIMILRRRGICFFSGGTCGVCGATIEVARSSAAPSWLALPDRWSSDGSLSAICSAAQALFNIVWVSISSRHPGSLLGAELGCSTWLYGFLGRRGKPRGRHKLHSKEYEREEFQKCY